MPAFELSGQCAHRTICGPTAGARSASAAPGFVLTTVVRVFETKKNTKENAVAMFMMMTMMIMDE